MTEVVWLSVGNVGTAAIADLLERLALPLRLSTRSVAF